MADSGVCNFARENLCQTKSLAYERAVAGANWLMGNWTLCEYSMRNPPISSFSGSISALNLMR